MQDLRSSLEQARSFSFGRQDLVPLPGVKPRASVLGALNLSHLTSREGPEGSPLKATSQCVPKGIKGVCPTFPAAQGWDSCWAESEDNRTVAGGALGTWVVVVGAVGSLPTSDACCPSTSILPLHPPPTVVQPSAMDRAHPRDA